MDMIRLLAKGVTDYEQLLNYARGKVIKKKDQLAGIRQAQRKS
jgi:hypothetical protein